MGNDYRPDLDVCEIAEQLCAEGLRVARDVGGHLFVYKNGVYAPGQKEVAQKVKALLRASERLNEWSSYRTSEVVKYLAVDAGELWERPPLDAINLKNGILRLPKRELVPHSDDFLTHVQLPVEFRPTAKCNFWNWFFQEVLPPDCQEFIWELLAWLMLPHTHIQKAVLFFGEGGNGKGIAISAIRSFLGRANVSAVSLHSLASNRFAAARLVGKLANLHSDLPTAKLQDTSMFKQLTGFDELTVEEKYMPSYECSPFARLVFSANQLPISADDSEGYHQRWIVLPFERDFRGTESEIPRSDLEAALLDPMELSGALNLALDHLESVQQHGIAITASMQKHMAEFRAGNNPLARWLDDNTEAHPLAEVEKGQLYSSYRSHCEAAKIRPPLNEEFGRLLRRLRPEVRTAQRGSGSNRKHVYIGIKLRGGHRVSLAVVGETQETQVISHLGIGFVQSETHPKRA